MDFETFRKIMTITAAKLPRFAPNLNDQMQAQAWFEELKAIESSVFYEVMRNFARSVSEFPALNKILAACGEEHLTPEDEASKIAQRILEGAGAGSRSPAHIGEIGTRVLSQINGWYDISQMQLNDSHVYRTQFNRLRNLVLEEIKKASSKAPAIEEASTANIPKIETIAPNVDKKTPPKPELTQLIARLKLGSLKK